MTTASIIIPAFHSESYIAKTVQSVLLQSFTDWEMVIASDDEQDYLVILKKQNISDPRIRCISTGKIGSGAANARNCALDAAHGRVIVSLDADDLLQPEALKMMIPLALEHGAAYSDITFADFETGQRLRNCNRKLPAGLLLLEEILTSNLHTFAWIVFDRQKLPNVRWPEWKRWEDMFFVALCCDRLGKLYYTPQLLYTYHRRQGSVCNRPEAPREFHEEAKRISLTLDKDSHLLANTAGSREAMKKYLRRNHELELLFEQAMQRGKCRDYQEFMAQHLDRYYKLA